MNIFLIYYLINDTFHDNIRLPPPSSLREDLHSTGRNSALLFSLCSKLGKSLDFTCSVLSLILKGKQGTTLLLTRHKKAYNK